MTDCTLRAAIEESNALAGTQTITFNLPAGDETIYVDNKLPMITDDAVFDGTTQPGYDGVSPAVQLDGSGIVPIGEPIANGLFIDHYKAVTVKALQIRRFPRDGIENLGTLVLDHLEITANGNIGINSGTFSGKLNITLGNSAISENGSLGIYTNNTILSLSRVSITKNKGGMALDDSPLSLVNSTVADNTNTTGPGGIFFAFGDYLTIADSVIQGNTNTSEGPFAGGIVIWNTTANISHTTISENTGQTSGGIYIGNGTVYLIGSTLTKNRGGDAGGVYVSNEFAPSALYVESGSWIGKSGEGNIATIVGEGTKFAGGIYSRSDVHVYDSHVEGNSGAGIQMDPAGDASLQILRSHIRNNTRAGLYALNTDLTFSDGTVWGNSMGGIKMNSGSLTLTRSTVSDNYMPGTGGGISANNLVSADIRDSTLSGNASDSIGGGAYFALGSGTLNLSNATISGNRAGISGGGLAASGGTTHLNNVTLAGNTAPQWGGLLSEGSVTVENSLLAENSDAYCGGPGVITSGGHNLDDSNSCGFAAAGDLAATPAMLGPLQDNGGSTFTRALSAGSPSIDSGDDALCAAHDQRGIARPQGPHCDMGAFELETPHGAATTEATISPTPTQTPTATGTAATTLTPTPTRTASPIAFDPVTFSADKLFQGGQSCDPKTLTVRVRVSSPELVFSVGLFYRIEAKQGNFSYPWSEGMAMTSQGNGWYQLTLSGNDLPSIGNWQTEAWLDFQFVANDQNGQGIAWSTVYREVTLWQCYV